jgi:hypothetical protein
MAATGVRKLTVDSRENDFDLITEPDQDRDRDDGNKRQYQGVLDEGLTFLISEGRRHFHIGGDA